MAHTSPRLIVRLAVTGQRSIEAALEPAIRDSIGLVFRELLEYRDERHGPLAAPRLRLLSRLSEGADRIAAQELLELRSLHHVSLECPLPAAADVYEQDFVHSDSRQIFRNLLFHANAVFELDGCRAGEYLRASDYEAASRVAVANCDLVIAIWDGKTDESGGPGYTIRVAGRRETTVIRIDALRPERITVCATGDFWDVEWEAALRRLLLRTVAPPKDSFRWVRHYTGERLASADTENRRPDILASRYGRFYRASYRFKYLLSAFAVTFAVLGLIPEFTPQRLWVWPSLELLSIAGILLCFVLARRGDWHERWLDYRLLAEQFRVLEFLHPLGESVPVFNPPKYWGVPTARHSCVRWYFRARLHEVGLPNVQVTPDYARRQRQHIREVTEGQRRYNEEKHGSAKRSHKMVEMGGVVLFGVTFLACILHLGGWLAPEFVLGAITATLPAFGAAMEGLLAQAEDKRIAGNAAAMAQHMTEVCERIDALPNEAALPQVSAIAYELATEMTRETSGWHNLIHAQSPKV